MTHYIIENLFTKSSIKIPKKRTTVFQGKLLLVFLRKNGLQIFRLLLPSIYLEIYSINISNSLAMPQFFVTLFCHLLSFKIPSLVE